MKDTASMVFLIVCLGVVIEIYWRSKMLKATTLGLLLVPLTAYIIVHETALASPALGKGVAFLCLLIGTFPERRTWSPRIRGLQLSICFLGSALMAAWVVSPEGAVIVSVVLLMRRRVLDLVSVHRDIIAERAYQRDYQRSLQAHLRSPTVTEPPTKSAKVA